MRKIFLPSLISALVVFIWMFVSWAFLPWHSNLFKNIPNGDSLTAQMKASIKEPGIYRYPGLPEQSSAEALNKIAGRYAAGPVITFMVYNPSGIDMVNPMEFVWGFLIDLLNAIIAAFLLYNSTLKQKGFFVRLFFVILIAAFAALIGPIIEWNWLLFPAGYAFSVALDYLLTWLLGGAVLALMIKGEAVKKTISV